MKARAVLVCMAALAACDKTQTVTRVVNLHVAASCPIPGGSSGVYVATGDFDPASQSPILPTDGPSVPIDGVPADVQSLALEAQAGDARWLGVALVPPSGNVDLLLLPAASACPLSGGVGFDPGMEFVAVSPRTLVATGATDADGDSFSYRVDLGTGRVARMTVGIGKPRLHAATAALGDGRALVTGGLAGGVAQDTAEVFDEATEDFLPGNIQLQDERADHAAVTLANGDVLLVGGQNASGLVAATERVFFDGSTWRASEGSTHALLHPRVSPTALRLADGTVLVGGGTDGSGARVSDLEFLSADATEDVDVPFHARAREAYVALDGGGALYVAAPDATDDPKNFQRAWFVPPNGAPTAIVPDVTAPLSDVKLFPRAGGGAALWTGTAWLAFDPWQGFASLPGAPSAGPDADSPVASAAPGLRAWVGDDGAVSVWRDSIANAFATAGPFLTSTSATDLLAPARPFAPSFDARGLELDSESDGVFVADARYLDVAVVVDADASGALPEVVLRAGDAEVDVGGSSCPYPPASTATRVYVQRIGADVSYSLGGPLSGRCATLASTARVAVGLRGAGATVYARNFSVVRLTPNLH